MDSRSLAQGEIEAVGKQVILQILTNAELRAEAVKKKSGILLPTSVTQGQPVIGKVYRIGQDVESPLYKMGNTVIFRKKELFEGFKFNKLNLINVEHSEIVGIMRDE